MKHPVKKIISHLLMFALVLCVAIAPSLAESKPDCLQTISVQTARRTAICSM